MPALLIASLAVLLAATLFATRFPSRGAVAYVVDVLLLGQVIIVATVAIAGLVVGSLAPAVLLGLALAWLLVALVTTRLAGAPPVPWQSRARVGLAALGASLREPAVLVASVLVVGALAWRTFLALRLPVVDYDGWSYHLVFVDVWLQHDALRLVPQRPWTAGYPATAELLTTWLAAFTRTDALTGFTSLLPIPLAIAASTGLARAFGAERRWALFAGLLIGMIPALIALAGTTYVDAASVAVVTATWWLGIRILRGERHRTAALMLGIAGGLALGTKGTNALLVAPVLVVVAIDILRDLARRRGRPTGSGRALGRLALLVLPVVLVGGAWYLKNLVVHGNPLYPFAVGPFAGPTTLVDFAFVPEALRGRSWVGQVAGSWVADWDLGRYTFNVRPGGFGRAWPALAVLAVGGLLLLVRRRDFASLGLVVAPAAVTLLTMPMPFYARLTLFVPAVGLPLAALAIGAIRPRLATLVSLVLVGIAAVSLAQANIRPNIDIRAALGGSAWPGPVAYVEFLLDPSDERRSNVALRAECAGFGVIPAGARVAPGGFNLLHGVVGPDLDRILTDPIVDVHSPAELAAALDEQDATWLVTSSGGLLDRIAEAAPGLLVRHGEICNGGRLWQVRPRE